jgi:hypothetical protein
MLPARIAGRIRRRTALLVPVGIGEFFIETSWALAGEDAGMIAPGVLDWKRVLLECPFLSSESAGSRKRAPGRMAA